MDLNWLYSSMAQSGAAITAILGGFITSRVLALNAEKRSLKNQLDAMIHRLSLVQEEENIADNEHKTIKVNMFFNAMKDELKRVDVLPSLDELLKNHQDWELDPDVFRREYDALSERRVAAKGFLTNTSN